MEKEHKLLSLQLDLIRLEMNYPQEIRNYERTNLSSSPWSSDYMDRITIIYKKREELIKEIDKLKK